MHSVRRLGCRVECKPDRPQALKLRVNWGWRFSSAHSLTSPSWWEASFDPSFLQWIPERDLEEKTTQWCLGREAKIHPGCTVEIKSNFQTELVSFLAKSSLAVVRLARCLILNTLWLFWRHSLLNVSFPALSLPSSGTLEEVNKTPSNYRLDYKILGIFRDFELI